MMHLCHMEKSFNILLPVMFVNYYQANGEQSDLISPFLYYFQLFTLHTVGLGTFSLFFKALCL